MFSFGSAAFTRSARKMIKICRGKYRERLESINVQFWKYIFHVKVLENIIKSSKWKYISMRGKSTCTDNRKYRCSL
jgi:hypothetical protein